MDIHINNITSTLINIYYRSNLKELKKVKKSPKFIHATSSFFFFWTQLDIEPFIPTDVPPLNLFDPESDYFSAILWACAGTIIAIIIAGIIYEAFRMVFFGSTVPLGERLGLAHNAGYTTDTDALGKQLLRF